MTLSGLLLPLITLFFGALLSVALIALTQGDSKDIRRVQLAISVFALIQQALILGMVPTLFFRGELVSDSLSRLMTFAILLNLFFFLLSRRNGSGVGASLCQTFFILASAFGSYAVQSNRGTTATLVSIFTYFTAMIALTKEASLVEQLRALNAVQRKGVILFLVSVSISILGLGFFGDFQYDRIEKLLTANSFVSSKTLVTIQALTLFFGAYISGLVPSIWGSVKVRKSSTSGTLLAAATLMILVGVGFLVRWSLLLSSTILVTGDTTQVQAIGSFDVLVIIRTLATIGLILFPFLGIISSSVREGALNALLNLASLGLFLMAHSSSNCFYYGLVVIISIPLVSGVFMESFENIEEGKDFNLETWVGSAYRNLIPVLGILVGSCVCFGIPPFWASLPIWNIKDLPMTSRVIFIINSFLGMTFVFKLGRAAFQRQSNALQMRVENITFGGISVAGYVLILIFMGIFWQPLYKYSAIHIIKVLGT